MTMTCNDCAADNWGDGPVVLCALHATTGELMSQTITYEALIDTLIDAIEEARYFIAGYMDSKDDEYGSVPNDAMRADQLLEVVIAKARRARKVGAQ